MRGTRRVVAAAILVGGAGAALAAAPASAIDDSLWVGAQLDSAGSADGQGELTYANVGPGGPTAPDQFAGPIRFRAQVQGPLVADDIEGVGEFRILDGTGSPQRLGGTHRVGLDAQARGLFDRFPNANGAPAPTPGQQLNQVGGPVALFQLGTTTFQPQLVDSPLPNAPVQFDRNALRFSHFKCYAVAAQTPRFRARTVRLRDQFGEYSRVRLLRPVELCNPVIKRHRNRTTPITDTRRHFVVFQAQRISVPSNDLTTRNQFGTQRITHGNLTRVLVPAAKRRVRGPGRALRRRASSRVLDHYACYPAKLQAGRPTGRVRLTDQFERRQHLLTTVNGVCNPAEKVHRRRTTRVRYEDSHLVSIGLRNTSSRIRGVVVRTQFGIQGLVTRRATRLLVPSTKRICATWTARPNAPVTTLGGQRLGTLTRLSFRPNGGDPNGACPTVRS